jgi:lysophospholipase L1-like esterase
MTTRLPNRKAPGLILVLGMLLPGLVAFADAQEHWVATWAASPQGPRVPGPAAPGRGATPARGPANAAPQPLVFNNQTVRMVVRTTIGGQRARVQLSNAFGTSPLNVGAAHVALRDPSRQEKELAIVPASDRSLTFSGKANFTIPPGAEIVSDPVDLDVPKLGDLVISVYVPGNAATPTTHSTGLHTTYISKPGDFTDAASISEGARTTQSWYWISSVDVLAPPKTSLIVAYGDSITDGATSTPDTNSSWPSQLSQRLLANKATAGVAIVNQGISGNRVLSDGAGVSALARFDRDVLAQPGVKWVILMEGINDIGLSVTANAPITADELIAAHKQIIERAHIRGIRVIGATLTPFSGATYYSEEGEAIRQALNQWIRTGKAYDAVVDFDAVTRDPQNPKQLLAAFNIRDHLHPNDAGYKAMADAVDLSIFTSSRRSGSK